MKRAALFLALIFAAPASAFSLVNLTLAPATPLVWYEAHAPTGGVAVLSGYNGITTNTVNIAAGMRMYQRVKPRRLSMTTSVVGVGAGTYTYEAYDTTSAASICISGATSCTLAVGTANLDCVATGTASANPGDDVVVRVNATGCTTSPLGTVALEYTQVIADEGVDFVPRFLPFGLYGLDAGATLAGLDAYQMDTITCGWSQAGIVSGGTDVMRVQLIQKSDAGVVCTCDLPGTCADAPQGEHTCTCGGIKYLTDLNGLRSGYAMQLSTATNCADNPKNLICAIPFRK